MKSRLELLQMGQRLVELLRVVQRQVELVAGGATSVVLM